LSEGGKHNLVTKEEETNASIQQLYNSFDICSLGINPLEIDYWRLIDKILGMENLVHARPRVTFRVRQRLLSESHLRDHVGFSCVVKFADIIRICLEVIEAFSIDAG
tara:strand:+ start:338 stop:658 length:321 start_codon:yes stop_codon:yes gene_type:complete